MGKARRFNQYDASVRNARLGLQSAGLAQHNSRSIGGPQSSILIGERGTGGAQNRDLDKLPIRGGLLLGSIGFEANSRQIVAGVLDLGKTLAGVDTLVKGIVFMSPETGDSDTLDRITGKERDGQQLYLFGIQNAGASPTRTYTITHAAGGVGQILCPNDTDYVVSDDECVTIVDDVTQTDTWRLISTSDANGLDGGGVSFPITPTVDVRGSVSTNQAVDISQIDGHVTTMTLGADVTVTFSGFPSTGTQQTWELHVLQDGTGGRTLTISPTPVETVSIALGANKLTILTFLTNDGGTDIHVVPTLRGSISLSADFANKALSNLASTALNVDINMNTQDITNLDRLRFVLDSGAPTSSADPSIFLKTDTMILNMPTGDAIQLNINDVAIADALVVGTNNALRIHSSSNGALPILTFRNDDTTPTDGVQVARIGMFGRDSGATQVEYGRIRVDSEDITASTKDGSMHFEVLENESGASTTTFLSLNNAADGKITPFKNIHMAAGIDIEMVTNDIWLDEVVDGTRIQGTGTTLNQFVGGTNIIASTSTAVTLQGSTTLSIPQLFTMIATAATGVSDGVMWHDSGTGDVLVRSGGVERNLSNVAAVIPQTPLTSDIDADGFSVQDLDEIEFRDDPTSPASNVAYMNFDTSVMQWNVPLADSYTWSIDNVTQLSLDTDNLTMNSVDLDMNNKDIGNLDDIFFNTAGS